MKPIQVTIWNEFIHEKTPEAARVYPEGIHGAIRQIFEGDERFVSTVATLDMPGHGLSDEVLTNTDVLIWWGHAAHGQVADDIAEKVCRRVLDGMGFIALHASKSSKPFLRLMGTSGRLKYRVDGERERLWVIEPTHPIAHGLPEMIEIPHEEMYGERCDLPTPDELIFIGWFEGGEVFRSGCCYRRGFGKIFYFQPGHETYPVYYDQNIQKVILNAALWAAPAGFTAPTYGKYERNSRAATAR